MRGASAPTGADGRAGRQRLRAELEQAAAVRPGGVEEAAGRGRLPNGFEVAHELPQRPLRQRRGDLPGGRGHAGAIGVKVNLTAETKGTYFPKILSRDTGVLSAGLDAGHATTRTTRCSRDVDARRRRPRAVQPGRLQQCQGRPADQGRSRTETDVKKRNAMIREAIKIHRTTSATFRCISRRWPGAMKHNIDLVQLADNYMFIKWMCDQVTVEVITDQRCGSQVWTLRRYQLTKAFRRSLIKDQ